MNCIINENSTVLFIGDSITDSGRKRDNGEDLGSGYVSMAAAMFSALCTTKGVKFLNRGISGNRVDSLQERWQEDCVDLKPDYITILIGVNNTIHKFKKGIITPAGDFEASYRSIVKAAVEFTYAHIILMGPFLLPVVNSEETPLNKPVREKWHEWRSDLNPKIDVVRQIAKDFKATYIALDEIFSLAAASRPPEFWLPDGVHPTPAGHSLIALEWLRAVKAI